jgi:hypothetical protein
MERQRVCSDERVERADGRTLSFEERAKIPVAFTRIRVERYDGNLAEERSNIESCTTWLGALGNSELELGERDRADAELRWGNFLEVPSNPFVSVDDRDAGVGVEHDLHIARRFSARLVFPRRTGRSSGKRRSQKSPHSSPSEMGERTRAFPRRSIATSDPGSRIALGRRTAWLPPDQKSLPFVRMASIYGTYIEPRQSGEPPRLRTRCPRGDHRSSPLRAFRWRFSPVPFLRSGVGSESGRKDRPIRRFFG